MLRHDWLSIPNRANFLSFTLASLAWSPDGIGAPRPYPTDYLLAAMNAAVTFVAGPTVESYTWALAVGLICVAGTRALANLAGADAWSRVGLACFALFNPWVYTKVVSGHLAMICAYGAAMGLLGQCLHPKPRWTLAALFMCIIAAQIQFFLIALAFVCAIAVIRRRVLPLCSGLIVALPTLVGVAANIGLVAATPYALSWQSLQSVRPVEALALTGFFAGYTRGFPPVTFDAVWAMLALAIVGALRSRRRFAFVLLGLGGLAWSTALDGPFASAYAATMLRFPTLEIYRELYDLVSYIAIAYIALAASAGRVSPWFAKLTFVPGLVLLVTWFVLPPGRWWVGATELPPVTVDAPPHSRFALIPDDQPMTFRGRGSGLDPDAYARPGGVEPLDGASSAYPAAVALRNFAESGATAQLAALGVSRVIVRPWLATDNRTLSHQFALPAAPLAPLPGGTTSLAGAPELALVSRLDVLALPPPIGSNAVFFGDVAGLSGSGVPPAWAAFEAPRPIVPSGREISAARAWVDVRQAYIARPELAQGVGGVVTTSASAILNRRSAEQALVWIRGSLLDAQEHTLFRSDGGYRWIVLPASTSGLRCRGECVIAAFGTPPRELAQSAGRVHLTGVPFSAVVPWLVGADLPANDTPSFLRYEVGYDTHWLALTSHGTLPHLRVESAFNGWLLPAHLERMHVVLIEAVAAIQQLCEFAGLSWTLVLFYRFVGEEIRERKRPAAS